MNIKSLLLGSMAALCLLALPASAASDIAPFHPCPVATDPGTGTINALKEIDVFTGPQFAAITGDDLQLAANPVDVVHTKLAGDSGSVIAPPGIEGVVLASTNVVAPNPIDTVVGHPRVAGDGGTVFRPGGTRIVKAVPGKPVDVTTVASIETIIEGGSGLTTPYPCEWGKGLCLEGSGRV